MNLGAGQPLNGAVLLANKAKCSEVVLRCAVEPTDSSEQEVQERLVTAGRWLWLVDMRRTMEQETVDNRLSSQPESDTEVCL